jgi:hypothetical protein
VVAVTGKIEGHAPGHDKGIAGDKRRKDPESLFRRIFPVNDQGKPPSR